MEPLFNFFRDLISDLKSSRRFQVGTVLWIPLIVTAAVMTVRFGIHHTLAEKFKEWKHTFIPVDQLHFPNMLFYFDNQQGFYPANTVPICKQPQVPGSQPSPLQQIPCPFSWPNAPTKCFQGNFNQYTSSGVEQYQYHIHCWFMFAADQGQDNMIRIHLPGGFDTLPGGWHPESHAIRPNQAVAMHLEPEHIFPEKQPEIHMWHGHTIYESTIFTGNSPNAYNTSIFFRIPYTVIRASWETAGFDSWALLAAWGGGYMFFWLLHIVVFNIAKIWLPDDSKLIPGRKGTGAEYTPLVK